MSLSPITPNSSMPTSSSSPLKRSIHEVDDAAVQPPGPKRPHTDFAGENEENKDPSMTQNSKSTSTRSDGTSAQSPPNAEVSVKQGVLNFGAEADSNDRSNSITSRNQDSPKSPAAATVPTSHKRKLSAGSQDIKQREKEAKERQKLEEKRLKVDERKQREAKREEEKKIKEEEKKKREVEREEKKKAKEEEKAAKEAVKEDEKRRKEEEKLKKEQAQPKLNSFFAKPPLPSTSTTTTHPPSPNKSSPIGVTSAEKPSRIQSDYAKAFPEFFLQSHTVVAPTHRFERDEDSLKHVRHTLDEGMQAESFKVIPFKPSEIFHIIPYRRHRGCKARSVREILQQIQTAESVAMSAPNNKNKSTENPINLLRHVRMKSLKFGEDVRPPYQGTFTRAVPEATANKLARNPYHRVLPDTNYDYDSEAEWEEPEEGEDLDSEEEEEEGDDGDDDMDGFLDDEEDTLVGGKRRLIVGDLEPVCSGLQWASNGIPDEMKSYRMETISDAVQFPIDPFSTAYWQKPRTSDNTLGKTIPHRPQTLDAFRVSAGGDGLATGNALASTSKAKRPFPPELLDEFKQVVEGSDLSKIGVVEILKKRFPKVSKDTLKTTLDQVAIRVGQKEVDKKWVCR